MTKTVPLRVMAVFAHPDDPEFFCGATFARWAHEGAQITFVLATSGDKGSGEPDMTPQKLTLIREAEERRAAAVLGVQAVVFLRYSDGELYPTLDLRKDIVRQIRLHTPEIVVTNDPNVYWFGNRSVNHADHRAIGAATLDAVFPAAGNPMYFPELHQTEGLQPHSVKHIYLVRSAAPTVKVDVTAFVETKILALSEHKSQIYDMNALAVRMRSYVDPESPPGSPRYTDSFHVISFER
ncbi:MAG: PIG-L family deacetylase [Anaerolineae bacterium]|nr:PIG-L family deacetylase [Anaerolineae bacterium]